MSRKARNTAGGALLLGAVAVTGYSLYQNWKVAENSKEKQRARIKRQEEQLGQVFNEVQQEYISFLRLWLDAPSDVPSPILEIPLEDYVSEIFTRFEDVPDLLEGVIDDREVLRQIALEGFDRETRVHNWIHLLGVPELKQFAQTYHTLLPILENHWAEIDEPCTEDVMELRLKLRGVRKDCPRTFSATGSPLSPDGQLALRNVLGCYALADEEIGYAQGMNMIAYELLEITKCAPLAFAFFCQFMRLNEYGPGLPRRPREPTDPAVKTSCRHAYCSGGFNSKSGIEGFGVRFMFTKCLPGCIINLLIFEELLLSLLPEVHQVLAENRIQPQLFASEWFFTLFTYVVHEEEVLLRIWDMFLIDGYKALFRVGLAILQRVYPELIDQDFSTCLLTLKKFPNREVFVDRNDVCPGDALINTAQTFKITNQLLSNMATSILEDGRLASTIPLQY